MKTIVLAMLFLALSVTVGQAQSWSISVDSVYPAVCPPGSIGVWGDAVRIYIKYTNSSSAHYNVTNAFRVYSPDGLTWTSSVSGVGNVVFPAPNDHGVRVDTTGNLSRANFGGAWSIQGFGCDGLGDDTVAFSGVSNNINFGLMPGFDDQVFALIVRPNWGTVGGTICIDTVIQYTSANVWRWEYLSGNPSGSVTPAWGGPYCFYVYPLPTCCNGFTNCPASIGGSHCDSVQFWFQGYSIGGEPLHFILIDGPGIIEEYTGRWSAFGLSAGDYSLRVQASDGCGRGDYCDVTLHIVDSVHVSCKSSTPTAVAHLDLPTSQFPEVINDCDPLTFTLDSSGGVAGPVAIDPSTGELTFSPGPSDLTLPSPIAMRVTVTDGISSDIWVPTWLIEREYAGAVGNVDCDLTESVDIGDLTTLIDNLFITFTPLCSPGEANCDGDVNGSLDIGDLTALINNLFITFAPLPACQ